MFGKIRFSMAGQVHEAALGVQGLWECDDFLVEEYLNQDLAFQAATRNTRDVENLVQRAAEVLGGEVISTRLVRRQKIASGLVTENS